MFIYLESLGIAGEKLTPVELVKGQDVVWDVHDGMMQLVVPVTFLEKLVLSLKNIGYKGVRKIVLFFVLCVLGVYLAFSRCAFSTTYHIGVTGVFVGFFMFFVISGVIAETDNSSFQRQWIYASETSAIIYWQLDDIKNQAHSYIEHGKAEILGERTAVTNEPRWSQFHRLKALDTDTIYYYRMVIVNPVTQRETKSDILTFTARKKTEAIRIPEQVFGPPFILDKAGATYILTQDVIADGTGFLITGTNISLDLDGHTVIFGHNTAEQVRGVWVNNKGKAIICNGRIVQGAKSKAYSTAIESRWRAEPTEIFGISTDVHLKCAYPIKFLGAAKDAHIHHNHLYSRVTEIENRHYPGNDLLRLDIKGGHIYVHDNLLTEGCHIGIRLAGEGPNVEVNYNDIRHHQQYVNGYAVVASCAGSYIHHNKVTSCGRGVHLTNEGIRFHDNYLDIYGHQQLSDLPKGSRPWKHQRVELHGVKFEGRLVKNCKIYNNFVRIIQRLPHDSDGNGSPEEKIISGVYARGRAAIIAPDRLVDITQDWEADRWQNYFVKYAPNLPPVRIIGNNSTTLFAAFKSKTPSEYIIYMKWEYVPATPLNVACYEPNAMNEVYSNTFVALTEYRQTRHRGYGDSGQWASSIHFVGMNRGQSQTGAYSIFIHDNQFISNDLFASADQPVNMTIRIKRNRFTLSATPLPTKGRMAFRKIGTSLENLLGSEENVFEDAVE